MTHTRKLDPAAPVKSRDWYWLTHGVTNYVMAPKEVTESPLYKMDDGARRWLLNTARRHYWRVCNWYDLDDLIQDGITHYYLILARYPKVKDRPHIMSLFQLTFNNHINDLSRHRSGHPEILECALGNPKSDDANSEFAMSPFARLQGSEPSHETICLIAATAPEPVRKVLAAINSDRGARTMRAAYRVRKGGVRETLNERLCRLIGMDPLEIDLVGLLRSHLTTV